MKGKPSDRLVDMEVFVEVAKSLNFTQTAERLNMNPSSISKIITKLETRLGVRLINRTTRKVNLTEEGEHYYHNAIRILADIEETENVMNSKSRNPQGKVRITCSAPFAYHQLIPMLSELIHSNTKIDITLFSTDQITDITEKRCDIAIRIGHLPDSSLKARKLAETKRVLVASPDYLKKFGIPKHPRELNEHICLNFYAHSVLNNWSFAKSNTKINFEAKGSFSADDGESLRTMTLAGGGIVRLSSFIVKKDIAQKKLVPLLNAWNSDELYPIYLLHAGYVPARVKFVIDYLIKKLGSKIFE